MIRIKERQRESTQWTDEQREHDGAKPRIASKNPTDDEHGGFDAGAANPERNPGGFEGFLRVPFTLPLVDIPEVVDRLADAWSVRGTRASGRGGEDSVL